MGDSLGRVAVVGGAGAVGRLFAGSLAPQADAVHVIDEAAVKSSHTAVQYIAGDVLSGAGADVLASADVVVVALPEGAALTALPMLLQCTRDDALVVDTLSVKSSVCAMYDRAGLRQEVLSVNPMFAPALGFRGHGMLVVPVAPRDRADGLLAVVEAAGCQVVAISAEDHDRATANLQVMTHAAILALGIGLADADHDIGRLAAVLPPPHRMMLGLLARIVWAAPETYRDIQDGNPFADDARAALVTGVETVAGSSSDTAAFAALTERLRGFLGSEGEGLAAECARMLADRSVD